MFRLFALLSTIAAIIRSRNMLNLDENVAREIINRVANGSTESLASYYSNFVDLYAIPLAEFVISRLYSIYIRFTFINVVVFTIKYVPTTMYMYTFIKNLYVTKKERIKQKHLELEDIQLQIQIINNKICVREVEFAERQKHVRLAAERLRRLRARVKEIITGDETLRRSLENFNICKMENKVQTHYTPKEECELVLESLKEVKCDQVAIPTRLSERMECGETMQNKSKTDDDSVYSVFNDANEKQDCRFKIIKVTNVYKVAYLKHYIKQKRLRRANKQMLLKKKMESVKKLLEDWQKALNMVINSKFILNVDGYLDGASQEAMGDYSKPHESSDSDSDLRNSSSDAYYDEYSLSWERNQYRPYNYEDPPETTISKDFDFQEYKDMKYNSQLDDIYHRGANMVSILEETNSQMAIEEIKQDVDGDECHEFSE